MKIEFEESMEDIAKKTDLSEATKVACKEFDDIMKSLDNNFGDKVDYLNLMVKFFSKLASKENKQFANFYILVPILSLNFADYMTRGKEQITRKLSAKAFIYDDGLVLGIAFMLTLLKQKLLYKTLHWDEATTAYI